MCVCVSVCTKAIAGKNRSPARPRTLPLGRCPRCPRCGARPGSSLLRVLPRLVIRGVPTRLLVLLLLLLLVLLVLLRVGSLCRW